jgi:hypothetical protein
MTMWTTTRIARIRELRAAGWVFRQIAEELGTTRTAVAGIVKRQCIGAPSSLAFWTPERVVRLKQLIAAREDRRAIARELGCSRSAVAGKIARLGLVCDDAPIPTFEERIGWARVIATGCRWIDGDPRGD